MEGETVADGIRFVSSGTSAPGIHYVHADHLGSPQKMTDANQALVWDAVYTPFGQVHSITGTATNNQRFPGQYADAETGFNFNYFRDYDPTTGRYVQSDPIGLVGGLNRYGTLSRFLISPLTVPLIPRIVIPMSLWMMLIGWMPSPFTTLWIKPTGARFFATRFREFEFPAGIPTRRQRRSAFQTPRIYQS